MTFAFIALTLLVG